MECLGWPPARGGGGADRQTEQKAQWSGGFGNSTREHLRGSGKSAGAERAQSCATGANAFGSLMVFLEREHSLRSGAETIHE